MTRSGRRPGAHGLRMCMWLVCIWVACTMPVHARELRVAVESIPNMPGAPFDARSHVRGALFDGLTRFDANGDLVPGLATRWQNQTPTQWRFVLRRGVLFSNGEPLTAAAVVATLTWLQTDDGRLTAVGSRLPVLTAEDDDDDTVIIRTAKPDPLLARRLADVMIVAPGAWRDMGPEAYASTPITTGPFKIAARRANGVTLVANPASWRKPKADKIAFLASPDRQVRLRAVLENRADIATHLDVADIAALEKANQLTSITPAMAVLAVAFRQEAARDTPLRDERVRRALNHAVDKSTLVRSIMRGLGQPAGQPAARDVDGYDPAVKPYTYDIEKAKTLLADAGYGEGMDKSLTLRLAVTSQYAGDTALYDSLADMLAKVGVTVEITTIDRETWTRGVQLGAWEPDVDGFSFPFVAAPTNDAAVAMEPYSCLKPVPFVCDQTMTPKMKAAAEAMGVERRNALLGELGQAFHDQAPALYLVDAFDVTGIRRGVEGFAMADRFPVYENITVDADR